MLSVNKKGLSLWGNQNGNTMEAQENKFYNINHIVNANSTEMVDGSKWVTWSLNNIRKGLTKRRLNKIAESITE